MPHQSLEQEGISAAADKKQKAEMMDKKERMLHRGERNECRAEMLLDRVIQVRPGECEK